MLFIHVWCGRPRVPHYTESKQLSIRNYCVRLLTVRFTDNISQNHGYSLSCSLIIVFFIHFPINFSWFYDWVYRHTTWRCVLRINWTTAWKLWNVWQNQVWWAIWPFGFAITVHSTHQTEWLIPWKLWWWMGDEGGRQ